MMPDEDDTRVPLVYASVSREGPRPTDGHAATPIIWVFLIGALALWAGWYLGEYGASFDSSRMDGDRPVATGTRVARTLDPLAQGKKAYESTCSSCHQASGAGVPSQYPPLSGSSWVTGPPDRLVKVLLLGVSGPIVVEGTTYNSTMPAWAVLDDKKLSSIASYIRSAWGNTASAIGPEDVARVRASLGDRTATWSAAELEAEVK